jgi:16S rRNA (guanine527-N7)-methyltransferase
VRPKVQRYAQLLLEWNRSINLTGARTLEEVEALIDDAGALVEASWKDITTVIDIGSGGGLPAIPLAVAMPQVQFTLLEANARKCAFLEHAAGTLGLTNVVVAQGRAEELAHRPALREQFDRAISRAAARPEVLLELALPFVRTGGDLVAQVSPLDPLVLEPAARLLGGGTPRLERPAAGDHALMVVPKLGHTPSRFPRRAGLPGRKPLA